MLVEFGFSLLNQPTWRPHAFLDLQFIHLFLQRKKFIKRYLSYNSALFFWLSRGLDQDFCMMKIKDNSRSMMHSYDELRNHFPFLIPQQTSIPSQSPTMSAACLPEYSALAHGYTQCQAVAYPTYPSYVPAVTAHHPCNVPHGSYMVTSPTVNSLSYSRQSNPSHTSVVKMSSETSAFEPISQSTSIGRRGLLEEQTLQKYYQ